MKITIKPFLCESPRTEPYLIGANYAQLALNVKNYRGSIEPIAEPKLVWYLGFADNSQSTPIPAPKTIFRYTYAYLQQTENDWYYWFTWPDDVDVTRGPLVDDPKGRIFFTGDGPPKQTDYDYGLNSTGDYPSESYLLGLPAPFNGPSISNGSLLGTDIANETPTRIVAAVAFVNMYGEVGPLGPASNALDYYATADLVITIPTTTSSGSPLSAYKILSMRVFISQTDLNGETTFRFWIELPIENTTWTAKVNFALLAEAADSPSLVAPPSDLFGLMLHPAGFLQGFTKNKFCRSEVWKPYGWPTEYQDPIADDIVGGAVLNQSTVICTRGKTYIAIGQDPLNMSIVDLAGTQPCVAKRTIKAMPFGVLYVSPDGLVLVNGTNPLVVISQPYFTKEQWTLMNPEAMLAGVQDNRYYLAVSSLDHDGQQPQLSNAPGMIIFEFGADGSILQISRVQHEVIAMHTNRGNGDLYFAGKTGSPPIYAVLKWDAGDQKKTMVWRSREYRLDRSQNIGAFRVKADAYPVTVKFFGDNTLLAAMEVMSSAPERLPGLDRYKNFYIEVSGVTKVTEIEVASSIYELRMEDG